MKNLNHNCYYTFYFIDIVFNIKQNIKMKILIYNLNIYFLIIVYIQMAPITLEILKMVSPIMVNCTKRMDQ